MIDNLGLFTGLLCALVWLSVMAQGGHDRTDMHNRQSYTFLLCGLVLALWIAPLQLWAALLLGSALVGVYWMGFVPLEPGGSLLVMKQRNEAWRATGWRLLVVAGTYGALVQIATSAIVVPVLWTMVAAGMAMAGYSAAVLWLTRHDPYGDRHCLWRIPWTPWVIQDDEKANRVRGAQGNPNHLDGLQAMSVGAAMGLGWIGWTAALWVLPLLLIPFVLHGKVTQGTLHLSAIAGTGMGLLWGWAGWLTLGAGVAGLVCYARPWRPRPAWWDSNRMQMWLEALRFWWAQPSWAIRLIGFGMMQWPRVGLLLPQRSAKPGTQGLFMHAHNEYVQQLVEHGLVGFVLLLGYLASTAWHLVTGGPEAQAVLLVAVPLCSVAAINFPWSFFQEVQNPARAHDPWPRFYSDLTVAMQECERWRAKTWREQASNQRRMQAIGQHVPAPILAEQPDAPQWKKYSSPQAEYLQLDGPSCVFQIRPAPLEFDPHRLVAYLTVQGNLMRNMVLAEEPLYVGSPGLVAWSLVVAVLAAVVV